MKNIFVCATESFVTRVPLHASQRRNFITGQNEREETTQDTIVTKSAAYASYEINYVTYITATYTRAKRHWHGMQAKMAQLRAIASQKSHWSTSVEQNRKRQGPRRVDGHSLSLSQLLSCTVDSRIFLDVPSCSMWNEFYQSYNLRITWCEEDCNTRPTEPFVDCSSKRIHTPPSVDPDIFGAMVDRDLEMPGLRSKRGQQHLAPLRMARDLSEFMDMDSLDDEERGKFAMQMRAVCPHPLLL
jgi:hypothetical protein